jgi:DNA-binding NarL/FixJ family response regulator
VSRFPIHVLVVDDYQAWRRFAVTTIQREPEWRVIGEVSDGVLAVQMAQQLQPDLIVLDIGLPSLNGIQAARQIRNDSPNSRILFLSENRSSDIVEEALRTGAGGYVLKSDAATQLLPAMKEVLQGKQFVSSTLVGKKPSPRMNERVTALAHCHEVAFFADDASLMDGYARFVESTLRAGNAVVIVETEPRRASVLLRLEAHGFDVAASIERGTLIPMDSTDALSSLMVDDTPEPTLCAKVAGDLIARAAKSVAQNHGRVVFCGGTAPILLSKGNMEGAIQLEHIWDEVTRGCGVQTLCGYLRTASLGEDLSPIFDRICAEHTAVRNLGY